LHIIGAFDSATAASLVVRNTTAYGGTYNEYPQIWLDSAGNVMARMRNDGSFFMGGTQGYVVAQRFHADLVPNYVLNRPMYTKADDYDTGMSFPAANNINFVTDGVEAVRIDGSGSVGIKTASPTAKLHLPAGTATASTAPLKFTSGTANTTAETGAMEYSGTQLTFVRTGTVREVIGTVLTKTDTGDPTGAEGLFCINTNDNNFKVYAEGAWRSLATW